MNRETGDSFAAFAAILAQGIGAALVADGRSGWELTPELVPEPQGVAPVPGTLAAELQLAGTAVNGACALLLDGESARALAGLAADAPAEEDAVSGALLRLLEAASPALAEAFSASLEPLTVSAAALPEPPAADSSFLIVARLAGSDPGGRPVVLHVCLDDMLRRSLANMARLAAAGTAAGIAPSNLGLVMDVELNVSLRFGQRQLSLREVMELSSGSVIELDREVDEPVELILDGRVIARGEAVIVDGNYGMRVTEVLHPVEI